MNHLSNVIVGRIRARYWGLLGARLGLKSQIGARFALTQPHSFKAGFRLSVESDVFVKIVKQNASVTIGDYCFVGRGSQFDIESSLVMGDHVLLAPGVFIVDHNHRIAAGHRIDQQGCDTDPIQIGNDVWIGANAVILPGVKIGHGAVIGACSCVTRDVEPYSVSVGVPARMIRSR